MPCPILSWPFPASIPSRSRQSGKAVKQQEAVFRVLGSGRRRGSRQRSEFKGTQRGLNDAFYRAAKVSLAVEK
ncbi:hypothetical protein E2C01_083206 [Portunus trituberculatus]|uniref:Uncharacterized protein n=1 Tax=Portunus trituberculatus TaxID=210409 RepID=A0A5B7J0J9_PORTR|nr:hypothetical protein [Portunus trituberculatus]